MVIIFRLNQKKNYGLDVLFPVEKSFHVFNLACVLRDHFSNLCGSVWEDQSKCKQRTVGTGFTVLRGGGGRGGGFNILGQSIIRAE